MVNFLVVIIEPLATAQYFLNITELLKNMHQYQQQRIIIKIMDIIILSIMKVHYIMPDRITCKNR